jgi:hypothetical protein
MNLEEVFRCLIVATEDKNKKRVLELNKEFDSLVTEEHPKYREYDNLRQSCIMAFTFPTHYEICLEDAKKRFKRIYG